MSKYLLDKFLFTVDRDPELVERYRDGPGRHRRRGGRPRWPTGSSTAPPASESPGWPSPTRSATRWSRQDHVRALRDGRPPVPHPDPVHRDVRARPRAAGVPDRLRPGAWSTCRSPTPTSRPDMRRRPAHAHGVAAVVRPSTRTRAAAGRRCWSGSPRRPSSRWTCCARRGTSYFGAPALPYVPGVQGVGVVEVRRHPAGTRVWFFATAGMKPGDGSLAELVRGAGRRRGARRRRTSPTRLAAAFGLSGVAAWMALTWRARAAARRAGARARRRWRRRSGRRRRRPASWARGRVVAVVPRRRRSTGRRRNGARRRRHAAIRRRRPS